MFQTIPAPSATQDLTLNFYLKHFRASTVDYILKETGYENITEYEMLCRNSDLFPARITVNGILLAERPNVDENIYQVFELSLHHLSYDVRSRIMDYYIGMNLTDYELQFADYNTLYVAVPRKSQIDYEEEGEDEASDDEEVEEDIEEETEDDEPVPVPIKRTTVTVRRRLVVESDDETDSEDEEDEPTLPLSGWVFSMNTTTKNSYILRPDGKTLSISNGIVSFQGNAIVSYEGGQQSTIWNAPIEGLERPLYYNTKYGGWIVSLRLRDSLIKAGAREL